MSHNDIFESKTGPAKFPQSQKCHKYTKDKPIGNYNSFFTQTLYMRLSWVTESVFSVFRGIIIMVNVVCNMSF